jgi:hypothetical protein
MHTGFWLGEWKERDDLEDVGVDGRVILKWVVQEVVQPAKSVVRVSD